MGKWKGAYDSPVSVMIWNVSSRKVNGEYRFRNFNPTKLESYIEDGVLKHTWNNGAFIEFFLGSEDVMIATYVSSKKDGRHKTRILLKRERD